MEREREEEGEKRKREPLFSRSVVVYMCLMLDHQVFLKATQVFTDVNSFH